MNEQLAGLLGAILPSKGWEGGYSPVNPDVYKPSFSSPNDIAVATDTIFNAQQQKEKGTATFKSPVEQPKSVGGDPTRPAEVKVEVDAKNKTSFSSGEWFDNPNASTAFQVKHWLDGTVAGMKAISSVYNGYSQSVQYNMQATSMEYMARQNQRNADLMRKNIREINRAAQSDINAIYVQTAQRKSEQRVAQGASGFAVGKGVYEVLNDNTDWKTNYNASLIMLKAGLQGAEIVRSAGNYEAQSIINKSEAEIARKNADVARINGWVGGVIGAMSAATSFYIGRYGVE
nr:MAG TPA: hypothetical protein [Caudoviricetes sp.]